MQRRDPSQSAWDMSLGLYRTLENYHCQTNTTTNLIKDETQSCDILDRLAECFFLVILPSAQYDWLFMITLSF